MGLTAVNGGKTGKRTFREVTLRKGIKAGSGKKGGAFQLMLSFFSCYLTIFSIFEVFRLFEQRQDM